MSRRFYYTLAYASKPPNFQFSRAFHTQINHINYPRNKAARLSNPIHSLIENEKNLIPDEIDYLAQLQKNGALSSPYVLNKLVSLCANSGSGSLRTGVQIHSAVIKMGFHSNLYIGAALVDMYGKCGVVTSAHELFDEMRLRNVVAWNSLISGYLRTQFPETAIRLFLEMVRFGISLSPFSVSAVLVGCAQLEAATLGAQVHGLSVKVGFDSNVVVGTGLVDLYSKCSRVDDSRRIFDVMPDKNVVSWTVMITGYAQNQQSDEAMHLLREMLGLGFEANYVTYNSLLSSLCHQDDMNSCKQIHCRIIKEGLESDAYLVVTLMTVYSEHGCSLEDFYKICSHVTVWDQISWNAVIAGFSNLGSGQEALACFSRMRQEGVNVDYFTFASVLRAVGVVSALDGGMQTHALLFKLGYTSTLCIQNGLVSMYAKCGKMDQAKKVFFSMVEHDLISWNSLLSGCAYHGHGRDAIEIFEEMRKTMIKPDLSTYLSVLSACSHVGFLDKGLEYFNLMKNDASLGSPKVEHYACIVDLYGRAGYLTEAETFVNGMPIEPGPSVFKALLSACGVHLNKDIAVRAATKLVELCPDDPATYVLLSNVLSTGGYWDDSAGVRRFMCNRGVKKAAGYSWI